MTTDDDGTLRTFDSGATRDTAQDKLDPEGFFSPAVLWEFSRYMHRHRTQSDGSLRDSDNWQKGMPRAQYLKSLVRHVFELWHVMRGGRPIFTGPRDPQHPRAILCAVIFNAQGLLHEILQDREVRE